MMPDLTTYPWNQLEKDFLIQLAENVERENYNEIEIARAQQRIRRQLEPLSCQGHRSDLKGKGDKTWHDPHGLDGVIAKLFHESHGTVTKRKRILEALETYPERYAQIGKQLKRNDISVTSADNTIQRDMKKRQILSTAPKIQLPKEYVLHHGDFSSEKASSLIAAESIDLIITDPPYDGKSLFLYEKLAKTAARVLKQGACIAMYCGQYYLPQIMSIFENEKALQYHWQVVTIMSGRNAHIYNRGIIVEFKPILIYIKGGKRSCSSMMPDLIGSESKAPNKILHPWEQKTEEAEHLIRYLSYEGQVVFDPMAGTGTTGIAALKLGRKFVGFEINGETRKSALAKLAHWSKSNQNNADFGPAAAIV
jgi:16S rRNA G966 N2-methylase RsmD